MVKKEQPTISGIGSNTDYTDFVTHYTDKHNQCNHKKISGISDKGFTLVEVLLAVSILAIGIIGVLRGYVISINALGVAREVTNAVCLLKEKMLETEQIALEQKGVSPGTSSGEFEDRLEGYKWELEIKPTTIANLNEVILIVSHKESPRKFSLVTYVESK